MSNWTHSPATLLAVLILIAYSICQLDVTARTGIAIFAVAGSIFTGLFVYEWVRIFRGRKQADAGAVENPR
jgi:hypothetical protein